LLCRDMSADTKTTKSCPNVHVGPILSPTKSASVKSELAGKPPQNILQTNRKFKKKSNLGVIAKKNGGHSFVFTARRYAKRGTLLGLGICPSPRAGSRVVRMDPLRFLA